MQMDSFLSVPQYFKMYAVSQLFALYAGNQQGIRDIYFSMLSQRMRQ